MNSLNELDKDYITLNVAKLSRGVVFRLFRRRLCTGSWSNIVGQLGSASNLRRDPLVNT